MNKNTELFELIPLEISTIVIDDQTNDYMVGVEIGDATYALKLNSYEGTILTFVDAGCADHAHINTIHQILLKFKNGTGFELKRVIIEAKYGDVFYCRLHWEHEVRDIYNIIGLGDALILALLSAAPIFISSFIISQLEKLDSDGYMQIYED